MELAEYITLVCWALATCLQFIFMLMAGVIYFKNKEKLFAWYGLYCLLMFVYCTTKTPDFLYPLARVKLWKSHYLYQSFYWYLQILYHLAYMSFGISFVRLSLYKPRLSQYIQYYQKLILAAGSVCYLLGTFRLTSAQIVLDFFIWVFMPLHIVISIAVLSIVTTLPKRSYIYICGTSCYMLLILLAFILSYYQTSFGPLRGPAIFYIGIAIESSIFSLGLGLRIRDIYRERMAFQYNLNEAHLQLEKELKKQIDTQQREKHLLNQLREKQELDIQVEKLYNQVLRSQLNSHFIFNVLNSIKLFILEKNTQQASSYLSKFAKFIRLVLDSSIHEYHSLKEELDMLDLYVSIERVRLGERFYFSVIVEDDLNTNNVRIPALLLQPFVENALWHGVKNMPGNKTVIIHVFREAANTCIWIDDNGPGIDLREKMQSKKQFKSYGLKIVEDRIRHHNNKDERHISHAIINKKQINQTGTRVEVIISL